MNIEWLKMNSSQVLNKFAALPGAVRYGNFNYQSVFIPGSRNDKVIFVAHADTVWKQKYVNPVIAGNKIISATPGCGIGGDDRAGCDMVWRLRNLGHSILVTTGEEAGGIASRFIMKTWMKNVINAHSFIVDFDRRGIAQAALYECATIPFVQYLKESLPQIHLRRGAFTDICVLCKSICGVNLSVGYFNEHTPNEYVNIDVFRACEARYRAWLSGNTPKFAMDTNNLFTFSEVK